jgi:xanthine dehydrogenase accessory factor
MEYLRSRRESIALATVITRNESAPRSAGAKMMMIKHNGVTIGTVGGGILEVQVKQLAVEMLKKHQASVKSYQFSGNDAAAH